MKHPQTLTDAQLIDYSEKHLVYEIGMLHWTAAILYYLSQFEKIGAIGDTVNNGLLNSFSMHARNLIDFLYSRSHYKSDRRTDIIIEDYIPESTLYDHLPQITELLTHAKFKANKQVAHLTTDRIDFEEDGDWEFMRIHQQIMAALYNIHHLFQEDSVENSFLSHINKKEISMPKIDIYEIVENGHGTGLNIQGVLSQRIKNV